MTPEQSSAAFHLMRIDEVMAGSGGDPSVQFVELQMTSSGQRFVSGHFISFRDSEDSETGRFTFPGNVTNSNLGESILVGTAAFAQASNVAPDFTMNPGIMPTDGRVCFESIDCVAYGNFAAPNSPYGSPAPALPTSGNNSLKRVRTATPRDNSTDYALQAPEPRNNSRVTGDVTPPIPETPGLNTWGLIALAVLMSGAVALAARRRLANKASV